MGSSVARPVPASTINCTYLFPQMSVVLNGSVFSQQTAFSGAYLLSGVVIKAFHFSCVSMHALHEASGSPLSLKNLIASDILWRIDGVFRLIYGSLLHVVSLLGIIVPLLVLLE